MTQRLTRKAQSENLNCSWTQRLNARALPHSVVVVDVDPFLCVDETMEVTMFEESAFPRSYGRGSSTACDDADRAHRWADNAPLDKFSTIQSSGNGVASLRMQSLHPFAPAFWRRAVVLSG